MFYVKDLNASTYIHLDLSVIYADSPEFHDLKHISRGNGAYTYIRGWFLNVSQVWKHIPSCNAVIKE